MSNDYHDIEITLEHGPGLETYHQQVLFRLTRMGFGDRGARAVLAKQARTVLDSYRAGSPAGWTAERAAYKAQTD